jgi:surface polysaccharide O-acyltransferase-like enzyme
MHRGPFQNATSVFQSVLFFTPVYLLGIISSEKKDIIYSKLTGKEFYILILIILLAGIQVYSGKLGNYVKDPFTFEGIDLMVIQKIIFCLFFMVLLNRFENYKFKLLEIIANNSFGVYFIHGIVLYALMVIKRKSGFSFPPDLFITYFLVSLFVFFISLAITLFIKRIFPKYSRYLIGS